MPELVEAYSRGLRKNVRWRLVLGGIGAVSLATSWVWWGRENPGAFRFVWFLVVLYVGLPFALALATAANLRRSAQHEMAASTLAERLARVTSGPTARMSMALAIAWIAIHVVQRFLAGNPVAAAGLVKAGPERSELWRWLTAGFLHANALHLFMNAGALQVWGPLVEGLGGRNLFGVVLLVSLIGGSFASWWLFPEVPSIGASGAICGLLGFLIVQSVRHRGALPFGFGRMLTDSLIVLVALGVFLVGVIDNAAHLGGIAAGVLIGVLSPTPGAERSGRRAFLLGALGILSWTVLSVAAVFTVVRLVTT